MDHLGEERASEGHHQEARSSQGDEIDRPRVKDSADQIELSGEGLVAICLDTHERPTGEIVQSAACQTPRSRRRCRSQAHRFNEADFSFGFAGLGKLALLLRLALGRRQRSRPIKSGGPSLFEPSFKVQRNNAHNRKLRVVAPAQRHQRAGALKGPPFCRRRASARTSPAAAAPRASVAVAELAIRGDRPRGSFYSQRSSATMARKHRPAIAEAIMREHRQRLNRRFLTACKFALRLISDHGWAGLPDPRFALSCGFIDLQHGTEPRPSY
jgi:hypothetical protein